MISFKIFQTLNSATVETSPSVWSKIFWLELFDLNIVNLINLNYRHNDSDLNKGFIQRLLAVTTNVNTDDLALLKRHRAALKELSRNNTRIIPLSDKDGGVIIMDSTHYNNKMMELWDEKKTHTN